MVNIYLQGMLGGVKTTEFEGKKTINLQFLVEDEVKGLEVISVKVSNEEHLSEGLVKGVNVKCPIMISAMGTEGSKKTNTYYRTAGKIQVSK
jgi:hypothetical protein